MTMDSSLGYNPFTTIKHDVIQHISTNISQHGGNAMLIAILVIVCIGLATALIHGLTRLGIFLNSKTVQARAKAVEEEAKKMELMVKSIIQNTAYDTKAVVKGVANTFEELRL